MSILLIIISVIQLLYYQLYNILNLILILGARIKDNYRTRNIFPKWLFYTYTMILF